MTRDKGTQCLSESSGRRMLRHREDVNTLNFGTIGYYWGRIIEIAEDCLGTRYVTVERLEVLSITSKLLFQAEMNIIY
ncbi:hypothetical protein TMatcc_000926 [Talaromyces marneffei ATCC 18224]